MSANEWANLIATTTLTKEDIVEKGYRTALQISEDTNTPVRTVRRKLAEACKTNKVERRVFRVAQPLKGVAATPHYRIIKTTK